MSESTTDPSSSETSASEQEPYVTYKVSQQVATITLARPDLRNVMNGQSMRQMHDYLLQAGEDQNVRVVVITGSGNTFCAGADLKGATEANEAADRWSGPGAIVEVLHTIQDLPKPVIARIQGHVAGGGNGLAAACDLSIAAESAMFAFSEVRLGLAPAVISVVCVPKMRTADAAELMLTGERVPASRVASIGLINRAVPDDVLDAEVQAYIDVLLKGGPHALAATKKLLSRVTGMTRDEAYTWTSELSGLLFGSEEAAAGMRAFLQRKPAPWDPASETAE